MADAEVIDRGHAANPDPRISAAWGVLESVLDPEVPALSLVDLGIVREVQALAQGLQVVLTPTYSGCPATESSSRAWSMRWPRPASAR
jgi:metal-sulfur cluster biosynthetic enzyme